MEELIKKAKELGLQFDENISEEELKKLIDEQLEKGAKTYTKEEFEKELQREADRRVTKALQTAKEKWEKEFRQKLEEEKAEAEKLAAMNEKQKAEYELQKIKEELEQHKRQKERLELEKTVTNILSEKKLPLEFMSYVISDTAEKTNERINTFEKLFNEAVAKAVDEKFKTASRKEEKKIDGYDYENITLTQLADIAKKYGVKSPEYQTAKKRIKI